MSVCVLSRCYVWSAADVKGSVLHKSCHLFTVMSFKSNIYSKKKSKPTNIIALYQKQTKIDYIHLIMSKNMLILMVSKSHLKSFRKPFLGAKK